MNTLHSTAPDVPKGDSIRWNVLRIFLFEYCYTMESSKRPSLGLNCYLLFLALPARPRSSLIRARREEVRIPTGLSQVPEFGWRVWLQRKEIPVVEAGAGNRIWTAARGDAYHTDWLVSSGICTYYYLFITIYLLLFLILITVIFDIIFIIILFKVLSKLIKWVQVIIRHETEASTKLRPLIRLKRSLSVLYPKR